MVCVEENLGLVAEVLNKKFTNVGRDIYDDLMQEGYMALINCVKTYNNDSKYAFSTYAYNRIYWQMIKYYNKEKAYHECTISGDIVYQGQKDDVLNFVSNENVLSVKDYINENTNKTVNDIKEHILSASKKREKGKKIIKLFLDGERQVDIAKNIGVSRQFVNNAVKPIIKSFKNQSPHDLGLG